MSLESLTYVIVVGVIIGVTVLYFEYKFFRTHSIVFPTSQKIQLTIFIIAKWSLVFIALSILWDQRNRIANEGILALSFSIFMVLGLIVLVRWLNQRGHPRAHD